MKVTLIHGENSEASLDYLKGTIDSFKKNGLQINKISDSTLSLSESLSAGNLFSQPNLYLLENPAKISPQEIKWLSEKTKTFPGTLIIYYDSQQPVTTLKALSGISEVKEFKLPRIIFSFLESFVPGKARESLLFLHELVKRQPPEFVFAVLAKHLRDLYWAKVAAETLEYPDWRLSRLRKQASTFSEEKIKKIINALAKIDVSAKTSKQELTSSLDLLIASQLQ
jgi:DNA polymerase III delta subunit